MSKDNSPTATLRIGNLPKPEKVKDAEPDNGEAHKLAVQTQCGNNTGVRTLPPNVDQVVSDQ